jgi:acyl dehydratase
MKDGFENVEIGSSYSTQGRTITEADIVNFAGVSGDFNHLHTDAEAMGETPLGERVAHGSLVFAVMTGLLWQSRSQEEREHLLAFYGVDNLRFVEPVFIGDTIHATAEVVDKEPKDHPLASGIVRQQVEAVNQHGETVQAAEFLLLVK